MAIGTTVQLPFSTSSCICNLHLRFHATLDGMPWMPWNQPPYRAAPGSSSSADNLAARSRVIIPATMVVGGRLAIATRFQNDLRQRVVSSDGNQSVRRMHPQKALMARLSRTTSWSYSGLADECSQRLPEWEVDQRRALRARRRVLLSKWCLSSVEKKFKNACHAAALSLAPTLPCACISPQL